MAKKLREGDGKAGIARAGKRKLGYDTAQVDAFLERAHTLYDSEGINLTQQDIQSVSFELAKDGYVISQVDAALHRLEQAVVDKQTAWEIGQQGRVAWKAQTEKLYQKVASHVERAPRERFKPGAPKQPSYDKKQVDRIADQVVDKAAAALGVDGVTQNDVKGLADLNADAVNNVIFTQRKGKKGYDERQVDYFLNVCVQLLSRIESYARISDYVANGGASANQSTGASHEASGQVTPLIANDAQRSTVAAPQAAAAVTGESFDALRQAEQNLFPAPATAQAEGQTGASGSAPSAYTPKTVNQVPVTPSASAVPVQAPLSAQSVVQSPTVQPTAVSSPSIQRYRQALPVPSPSPDAPAVVPTTVRHDSAELANQVPPSFAPEPKPAATVVEPAAQAGSQPMNRNLTDSNPSLAALAHMAEVSQELPAVDASSFTPKMPSLNTPSALKLSTEPAANVANAVNTFTPAEQPAPQAQSAAASHAASPVAPAVQPATPAPSAMPVSFAPAVKPERNTGSVAVPVVAQFAAQSAPQSAPATHVGTQSPVEPQSPTGQPASELPAAEKPDNQHETKYSTLFPLIPNFDDDLGVSIPDLSFPTLNDDDTKKEQ
ncbi:MULTISPECIES: DivIVA domain-containing protein [unclassified Bifidobacterium]|uniref:DivIVA domain-containing protein n=1 Tax=unclassified Bifidobacterium TaxID=2608897 RepID=UPI0011293E9B|nr:MULTISPECIES: DivIVA domain-containing protein [unclassified Bifidobacterium]TPF77340.1 hypothetical protein BW09_10195 [Bifidobacterium sp. UTCIF-1]TPF79312.1 hypothetical protein BW08_10700 [Bifidobacterium sp. UTCIF-24]TPF81859.1 hypothetical protein BW12_07380 [Bifidobacterium sp. UTCIF-3]TPF83452.1 hypothetical protein BW07_10105 [Bifidobacterium sp. UTCIF-36]TPF89702.1 hypothetical protein BW10_05650 [Bifidobacterium sp. UTBIF-56]